MIEIENLTKKYDKFVAIENLFLKIPAGSIFGLVGINGAGKSTLLRILAGVFRSDEGSVKIDGEEIFENEKKKREILYLPDEPFSTPLTTGKDIVARYKVFYDLDENILRHYQREYKFNLLTPMRSLSKGMKRQLFVSIALSCSPKYLFVDEVFDGLDPNARNVFKKGIKELVERTDCTVIVASHSLKELEDICDSYGLIGGKKLLKSGDIKVEQHDIHKFNIAFKKPITEKELELECISFVSN
ncbi:MAG: ABC transporter ATP-binding protein [Firmicutes bacterium]|nr:ABC transporter ATP-binding protein [Bacillota bacterium]